MARPLKIGITCYPSVGGSGILASALGEELARRGEEVHFIGYERPFRLPAAAPRLFFHPVVINDYGLFKYPDYTLPLSVKMAEVSRDYQLDVLHVHYAVPHATAAILARDMLPPHQQPRVVTTLHGTDTTLLGRDPGYAPAIRHALACSDAITTVSDYLRQETQEVLGVTRPIDVIYNFFEPRPPRRSARRRGANWAWATRRCFFTPPISAPPNGLTCCWRSPPASARAKPSSWSFWPATVLRLSRGKCAGWVCRTP